MSVLRRDFLTMLGLTGFGATAGLIGYVAGKNDQLGPQTITVNVKPNAKSSAEEAQKETNIYLTKSTDKAFPFIVQFAPGWVQGTVDALFIITPNDVIEHCKDPKIKKLIAESFALSKKTVLGLAAPNEYADFIEKNDFKNVFEAELSKFLGESFPQLYTAIYLPPDFKKESVVSSIAEHLINGEAAEWSLNSKVSTRLDNFSLIAMPQHDITVLETACRLSGLPASAFDGYEFYAANLSNSLRTLAHEIGHLLCDYTGKVSIGLLGEANAEETSYALIEAAFKDDPVLARGAQNIVAEAMAIRAIGSVDFVNTTHSMTPIVQGTDRVKMFSELQFIWSHNEMLRMIGDRAVGVDVHYQSYTKIFQAALDGIEAVEGKGKIPLTTDEKSIVQKLLGHSIKLTEERYKLFDKLFKTLSEDTQARVNNVHDEVVIEYARNLFKNDPSQIYRPLLELYREGKFKENEVQMAYAEAYLWAAQNYLPKYFGVKPEEKLTHTTCVTVPGLPLREPAQPETAPQAEPK